MSVLVTEFMGSEGIDILRSFDSVAYDPELWHKPVELLDSVQGAQGLIVRNQTSVDRELLEHALSLRVVGRLGVGLDNIDVTAAREREVTIVYAKGANAIAVAEYVMAALLHCSRNLCAAEESVRDGRWDRQEFTAYELYRKSLGLIGVGDIGKRVARRALAFGMRVLGCDPFVGTYDDAATELGIELMGLDRLLDTSDFVSLHVPATSETRHLLDSGAFEKMKSTAWVINAARGEVINESDLRLALDRGLIRGAVLDVLQEEPLSPNSPLVGHDRILFTPHIAGLTHESQRRTASLVAGEVIRVLQGQPSLCAVR